MLNVLLIVCGITLIMLTIVVVYSNYRSSDNRWLGAFLVVGFLWLLANLLANNARSHTADLFFSRATLIGASLIPFTFLMFCYSFTGRKSKLTTAKYTLIIVPILALLLTTPTKLNIENVVDSNIKPGIAYPFLLIVLLIYFVVGISLLIKEYRTSADIRRQQLYYIILGTALTIIPGAVLSGILPIFGYARATFIAPSVVIFFAVFTSIAIVKHRLFDIRLVLARSLGYISSLAIIAFLYGFIIFNLSEYLFHFNIPISAQIFIATITALVTLTFSRVQKYFAKATNKVFYRDAYDSQTFLDQFNKVLVSTYELKLLLSKGIDVIEDNLKPSFSIFGIVSTQNKKPLRIVGTQGHTNIRADDINLIGQLMLKMHSKLVSISGLEDDETKLHEFMISNNISIIARLASSNNKEDIGYLMLGPKKSGNLYNSQDLNIVEIISNELVVAVQNALRFEEIQQFNVTLQQRVDVATVKLRRANQHLHELDEAKDDFISMASHQLRTPLTSIKGYVSMLLDGEMGKVRSEQQRNALSIAYSSTQQMVYTIADLLNVSRIKTGKFVIELSAINLADVISDEIDQVKSMYSNKPLTINYDKPKDFPQLMFDSEKIRQVIMNFIDNAVHYTPENGTINVKLIDTPETVEFRVEDNGIGVPKSAQHHLFTKMYRADNAMKMRPDGTGIGLYMAKKVIISSGGSLVFESQEGKGSTFGFTFSKSKITPKASDVKVAQE